MPEFAQALIRIARRLYAREPLGINLHETVYALDATTIDLCLSLFPWASFRQTKAAVKLHTLLDLRGGISSFIQPTRCEFRDRLVWAVVPAFELALSDVFELTVSSPACSRNGRASRFGAVRGAGENRGETFRRT